MYLRQELNDIKVKPRQNIHVFIPDLGGKILDLDPRRVTPIENDWQDEAILPKLENNLDIILKNPGVYPTEAITQFNPDVLTPFFTRLPQYS